MVLKRKIRLLLQPVFFNLYRPLFFILSFLPKQNKVVATTMRGRKYADNPRYIVEKLHAIDPSIDIVWFSDDRYCYELPSWIRRVSYYGGFMLNRIYEMATAKIWINSHMFESYISKNNKQLYIQTWHGGLGIKKILLDIPDVRRSGEWYKELKRNCETADVFISNSKFLDDVYRRAFEYNGLIYRSGFPKCDAFVNLNSDVKCSILEKYNLSSDTRIFLYAPTFRDSFEKTKIVDYTPYKIDFDILHQTLVSTQNGNWVIMIKFHPIMCNYIDESYYSQSGHVINVTDYSNMQELLASCDMFLTDYSSSIFECALINIPAFIYGVDYDDYKSSRGVYQEICTLPFPFAACQSELFENIKSFNPVIYQEKVNKYLKTVELNEPGNASECISRKIIDFVKKGIVDWN